MPTAVHQARAALLNQSSATSARPADKYRQSILIDRPARKNKQPNTSIGEASDRPALRKANTYSKVEDTKLSDYQTSKTSDGVLLNNYQEQR